MSYMKYFILIIILLSLSCKKKKKSENYKIKQEIINYGKENKKLIKIKKDNSKNQNRTKKSKVGDEVDLKKPKKFKNISLVFPDSVCGKITKRIYECKIEKVLKSSKLKKGLAKSIVTHTKKRFTIKLNKYIEHCKKTTVKMDEKLLLGCLNKNCIDMDKCLQNIASTSMKTD
jgi:hypothetical protein